MPASEGGFEFCYAAIFHRIIETSSGTVKHSRFSQDQCSSNNFNCDCSKKCS